MCSSYQNINWRVTNDHGVLRLRFYTGYSHRLTSESYSRVIDRLTVMKEFFCFSSAKNYANELQCRIGKTHNFYIRNRLSLCKRFVTFLLNFV